jgi:outer membrane protein OmpA-like peptidoglycan-associated protein
MNLSRRAVFAAASLLSAIVAMPPTVFADDKPPPSKDAAGKKNKHKNEHPKATGEKKAPPHGQPHAGGKPSTAKPQGAKPSVPQRPSSSFGKQGPPPKSGFHNLPPPNKRAATPSNNKPAAAAQPHKPPASKPAVINAAPNKPAPQHPVTEKAAPKAPAAGAKDHGRAEHKAGDRGKPEQRHFGEKGRAPTPGAKPPVVNPTNNPAVRNRPVSPTIGAKAPIGKTALPKPLPPAQARQRFENLRKARTQKVEGNKTFIKEGDRTIIKQNNRIVIQHDERERLRRVDPHARFERGRNGTNIAVIDRPGGVRIYSETDSSGHLLRRYRRGPDGRDVIIIDNRRRHHGGVGRDIAAGVGIGIGVVAGAAILNSVLDVPPPRVRIPRNEYIVDYDGASEESVYDALSAPPVEDFRDRYTLDEIRATAALRDRMRRVDLDDINFEFGSWEVDPSEYGKLDRVARAMKRVIRHNPNEVFMIEGYTDAVGSPEDNLSLSERRAESVAEVLSEEFQVPFENLVTQGYGEDYLKVPTNGPERLNRRVAVRRITPLLARGDSPPPPPPPRANDRPPPPDDRYAPPDNGPPEEHYEQVPGGNDPD